MKQIEQYLYRVGRDATLSPEDRNTILEGACEITILRSELAWARENLDAAFKREEEWSRMIKHYLSRTGMEKNNGTDSGD